MAINDLVRFDLPWLEPIEAVKRLAPLGPQLLDGMGAHPEARYAFVACSPLFEARFRGRTLRLTGQIQDERHGEPLALLQALVDEYRIDGSEPFPFTGGFVGYFAYEFAQAIEPTLGLEGEGPDAVLQLCLDAIVFDRRNQAVHAFVRSGQAADIRARWQQAVDDGDGITGPWSTETDQPGFEASVRRLTQRITDGDLFQANLAIRFDAECSVPPTRIFERLAARNPSPFMACLQYEDHQIVSGSPEQLFSVHDGVIKTRPIAGTRPRGTGDEDLRLEQELLTSPKERAEHTMLVDLLRNDIARVCRPGTTRVAEAFSVERYQHVMHLVSRVEGVLRPGTVFKDWLAALFPGGTITGAPKHRACLRIHEEEPVSRGPYTGSAGFLSWSHNAHWNIMIRTLVLRDGQATVHAGSGIVAESDPAAEWHEAHHKARALLEGGAGPPRDRVGEVTRHGAWMPPAPPGSVQATVLLIDNYDSFVHNLADYCALLGAEVVVVRNDEPIPDRDWSHVILGPGPGWPRDAGHTWHLAQDPALPTLGVCLGHQALAEANGGRVFVTPTVHGKTDAVHHGGEGLFEGLPSPFQATRYHSLSVEAPAPWQVTAHLEDGTVMAMQNGRAHGLQFHPESFCTEHGLEILRRFLEAP